jgi:DNA-binding transcriptional MerR regulator
VRFYERQGLLEKPARKESGYRQYPEDVVARLRFIKRAKELGFSLKEIKELLALRVDPDTTCAEVRGRAEAKIADDEEKIQAIGPMMNSASRSRQGLSPSVVKKSVQREARFPATCLMTMAMLLECRSTRGVLPAPGRSSEQSMESVAGTWRSRTL